MNNINISRQNSPSSRSSKDSYKSMNIYNKLKSALIRNKEKGISIGDRGSTNEMAKSLRGNRSTEKS